MSKHRAPRRKNYFQIAGCVLALALILGLLSTIALHSPDKQNAPASVVQPVHTVPSAALVWTEPDTPPKPTTADILAQKAALEKAQQEAAAEQAAQEKAAADAAAKAAAAKAAAAAPPPPPPPPAPPARVMTVDAYKAYAAGKVSADQFSCLDQMWTRESSWNPTAQNPSSTAYGIAQFLDTTWALVGYTKTSDPYTQIDAGLIYIQKSYQTPCGAWAFWQAHNYY